MELYTPEEVAELLKVQKHTVWNWLRKGQLKGIRINGRVWRIRTKDLDEFLKPSSEE